MTAEDHHHLVPSPHRKLAAMCLQFLLLLALVARSAMLVLVHLLMFPPIYVVVALVFFHSILPLGRDKKNHRVLKLLVHTCPNECLENGSPLPFVIGHH